MSSALDVYLNDQLAGKLTQDKTGDLQFQYDAAYVLQPEALAISLSLPRQETAHTGQNVKAFFSGLLPDDIVRHRLARFLGLSETNAFSLLEVIGGECAGALSLYPEGKIPLFHSEDNLEILDQTKLKELLELLKRRPLLAGVDDVRLSLAGAQDKIAVRVVGDSIALAKGATPTSHIIKPMMEGVLDSIHNELFCMSLAKRIHIDTPSVDIRWIGDTPYFLIERYDRQMQGNTLKRLHQEDFCQALGIPPEFKYEREGGPSVRQCLSLLENHSLKPLADHAAFIKRLIFNYLIGNSDAHGKNFSLLYKEKTPVLAPAYDLLSTAIYPNVAVKLAMKIGKTYNPEQVVTRYWHQIVPDITAAKNTLTKELINTATACLEQSSILKEAFQEKGIRSPVFEGICSIIQKRARSILD